MILLTKDKFLKNRAVLFKTVHDRNRNRKRAKQIQDYFNNLVDDYILGEDDEDIMELQDMTRSELQMTLQWLNSIPVTEDYNAIIRDNDLGFLDEIRLNNQRQESIQNMVDTQIYLFYNNMMYVSEVLNTHEIDKREYYNLTHSPNTQTLSRAELLNLASKNGINTDIISQQYGQYKNIDIYAENALRHSQMSTEHQSAMLNDNILTKEWVHIPNEHTRHGSNDGQYVMKDDYFNITNDITGETDKMMYPHDPNASFGNICNCYCEILYHDEVSI